MLSVRSRRLIGALLVGGFLLLCYWPLLLGEVPAGRDVFRIFIPDTHLIRQAYLGGEWPLWNPYIRFGQPLLGAMQAQALYPPRVLFALLTSPAWTLALQHVLHVLVAVWGTWAFCRRLGLTRPAAAVGALSFGFAPWLTHLAFTPNVAGAVAWTGVILTAADELARRPGGRSTALLAAAFCLAFLNASPEAQVWQAGLALLVLWRRPTRARTLGGFALGGAWALALAAAQLLPGLEMTTHSDRVADRAQTLVWSAEPLSLLSMVWPGADRPRGDYWDTQNLIPTFFAGGLVGLFVLASLLYRRRGAALWLGAGAALGVLSLGKNFAPSAWLLTHTPLELFRYPAKYALGAIFVLCVGGAVGLNRLLAVARRQDRSPRRAALSGAAWVGAVAVAIAAASLWDGFRPKLIGPVWFATFAALAAACFFLTPGPRRGTRVSGVLFALVVLELACGNLITDRRAWIRVSELERRSVAARALADRTVGRVSVKLDPDRERHGEPARRFVERSRDILVPMRFVEEGLRGVQADGSPVLARYAEIESSLNREVYQLTGTTHFVRDDDAPPQWLTRLPVDLGPQMPSLLEANEAQPRAFVVHRAERVDDETALKRLFDEALPARGTAFLSDPAPPLPTSACEGSTARISDESLNRLAIEVSACAEGYLVVSDMHLPGWKAEVDDRPAEILRANHFMRAVRVPAGSSRVEMTYAPLSFRAGGAVSLMAWLAMLATLISTGRRAASARGPGAAPAARAGRRSWW